MIDRDITDDELKLLREARASTDFVAFVDVFPRSTVGQSVLGWFLRDELTAANAREGQPYSGGAFFDALWSGNIEQAYIHADSNNKQHLDTLFGYPPRARMEPM